MNDMASLHDPQCTGERVTQLARNASELVVVSPFVTTGGLEPILNMVHEDARITLYTRWRADEVAAGVADPYVLDMVAGLGGEVRLHHLLHAKVYLRPGTGALVGSSNVTLAGLGWRDGGGIELLVEAPEDDPGITNLLELLEATSSQATTAIRDQVLAQAAAFDVQAPPEVESEPPELQLSSWLPTYSMPRALWRVYIGDREETVARLARPDLSALDPPPGLDEARFNAYVGSVLLQSLPGLVSQQLVNRTTYQAVNELARLAEERGLRVQNPEEAWRTLASWLSYFLPDHFTTVPGGRALHS